MSSEQVGKRIRDARIRQKLTTQELATQIGAARSTIYGWESGGSLPESKYFKAIREVLLISIDELFGLTSDDLVLSEEEKAIIRAYRDQPSLQEGVKRLLRE